MNDVTATWPQGPDEPPAHNMTDDYDWSCVYCFTDWDGAPVCPRCGTMPLKADDRVQLTDAQQTHYGTVTAVYQPRASAHGIAVVKWDSGMTERCLPAELRMEDA